MLKNLLLLGFRALKNKPVYTMLNLAGLVIGMSSCLLILLYVNNELSFDRFHTKKDRIVRVNYDILMGGKQVVSPSVPVFVAPVVKNMFPEIEDATRVSREWRPRTIRYKDIMFDEPGFCYADPNFFKVFDFKGISGNLVDALDRPNTVVITNTMAKKYFGNANPLGEHITFNNKKEYEIAAVMEDVPANSHFSFNFLSSHYSLDGFDSLETKEQWNNPNYATYLLLKPQANVAALTEKIDHWVNPPAEGGDADQNTIHLPLEPLSEVHFNTQVSNFGNALVLTDKKYLSIFGAIAALILLIACVNYINLATARASQRAKEVGIRKTAGAGFWQLLFQFLMESCLLILPAVVVSVGVVYLALPVMNNVLDKAIPFRIFDPQILAGITAGWLLLSVVAGFYPALVLSRFKPIATLKGNYAQRGGSGLLLRKGLVVFQFAISTMLIVGTFIVQSQLRYMQSTKLGLDKAHVLLIRGNADLFDKLEAFATKLRSLSGVESAAQAWRSPFETVVGNGFSIKANPADGSDWHMVGGIAGDDQYLQTLGIPLISGRNFDPSKINAKTGVNEFIVNEAFLRHYSLKPEEAVGKEVMLGITAQRGTGTIVGVIPDFHISSLRDPVEPVVMFNNPEYFGSLLVRLRAGDIPAAMAGIENEWKSFVPSRPFNFTFLDEQYDALYRTEHKMGVLMSFFAGFAILVACLGLFGLSAFTAERRTKEIGIRKVLGASVPGITRLLAKDFLKLVVVAIVIATPLAWYGMDKWLADFAFRIEIQWWAFVLAGLAAISLAFLTVGFQSVKAALTNPVKSLRSE